MTGLPTLLVNLDDGTGTYPYDITAYVRMVEGVSESRGRPDELQANQPGTLTLTVDNTDGRFTVGSGVYGIALDRSIRISLTATANLLSNPGFDLGPAVVTSWPSTGAGMTFSANTVTKIDGTQSLLAVGTVGGADTYVSQTVTCLPSTQYTMTAWRRVPSVLTAGALGNRSIWLQDSTGVTNSTTTLSAATTTGVWVQETVTLTTGAAAATITARLYVPQGAGGVLWDAVAVTGPVSAVRWTGKLQALPVTWPRGDDVFSVVQATATDLLAQLARKTLQTAFAQEVLLDSPSAFWPLSEAAGAIAGTDKTGNSPALGVVPPLISNVATAPLWSAPAWGTATGAIDGATGAQLTPTDGNALDMNSYFNGSGIYSANNIHFELMFMAPSAGWSSITGTTFIGLSGGMGVSLFGNGSTQLNVTIGTGDPGHAIGTGVAKGLTNGAPHILSIESDATSSRIFLDGVMAYSGAGIVSTWSNLPTSAVPGNLFVGFNFGPNSTSNNPTLTVWNINMGPRLTDARVIAHQTAALSDFLGETSAARIIRLASYVPVATGTIGTTGDALMGYTTQNGRSVLDCVAEAADADFGSAYADDNGLLSYAPGAALAGLTAPTAIIDANWFAEDTAFIVDMVGVVNIATGQANASPNVSAPIFDAASRLAHGDYPAAYTWNVSTDVQATDRTTWKIHKYAQPTPRLSTLTLDLMTADATTLGAALALDLNSWLRITGLPSQTPGGTTTDVIIQGFTETISATDWVLTLNVSQKSLVSGAWILDDPTSSVLDSTTILYF